MESNRSTCHDMARSATTRRQRAGTGTRRIFLKQASAVAGIAAASPWLGPDALAREADAGSLTVRSYASDPKDVDSVNTHWIETPTGIVIVDAQRLLPEAANVVKAVRRTASSVIGIFVTHAHTDHYGGLPILRRAFPDAPVYATPTTIESIREDRYGFNAARRERHGARFPSQEEINASLPDRPVTHGLSLVLGGVTLEIIELTPGEADATAVIHVPEHKVIFPGDLVQRDKIPMPFHSHMTWLAQLDAMAQRMPDGTLAYQGHGVPMLLAPQIAATRDYLTTARDLVRSRLDGKAELTEAARQDIAFELMTHFPFHAPGGGNDRPRVLNGLMSRLAKQIASGDHAGVAFRA